MSLPMRAPHLDACAMTASLASVYGMHYRVIHRYIRTAVRTPLGLLTSSKSYTIQIPKGTYPGCGRWRSLTLSIHPCGNLSSR